MLLVLVLFVCSLVLQSMLALFSTRKWFLCYCLWKGNRRAVTFFLEHTNESIFPCSKILGYLRNIGSPLQSLARGGYTVQRRGPCRPCPNQTLSSCCCLSCHRVYNHVTGSHYSSNPSHFDFEHTSMARYSTSSVLARQRSPRASFLSSSGNLPLTFLDSYERKSRKVDEEPRIQKS